MLPATTHIHTYLHTLALHDALPISAAASAMPIGMPGWPEAAASTASMASARMALARALWSPGERAAPRAGCLDVMAPVAGVGGRAGRSRRLGGAENAGAGQARQGG